MCVHSLKKEAGDLEVAGIISVIAEGLDQISPVLCHFDDLVLPN